MTLQDWHQGESKSTLILITDADAVPVNHDDINEISVVFHIAGRELCRLSKTVRPGYIQLQELTEEGQYRANVEQSVSALFPASGIVTMEVKVEFEDTVFTEDYAKTISEDVYQMKLAPKTLNL